MENELLNINEKLDILVKLLAHNFLKEINTQKDKILTLNKMKIDQKAIANILNIPYNTVTARISEDKKS